MENGFIYFILIAIITLFGSYIQGVTGFGFGIFSMMFLPSILMYTEANVLSSMLSSMSSLISALLTFRKIHFKNLCFPVLGCLISTYFAVSFIKAQSSKTLTLLLGIALFVLSIYFFFFTNKIKIKPTWYAGLIAGVISGIMGGMFAIGGPPVVIYFIQSEEDSDHYLATISSYFVFSGIIQILIKANAGFITASVLWAFAVGIVCMLVGSFIGKLTRDKTDPKKIKKVVYGVMAVSGIINIVTSLI